MAEAAHWIDVLLDAVDAGTLRRALRAVWLARDVPPHNGIDVTPPAPPPRAPPASKPHPAKKNRSGGSRPKHDVTNIPAILQARREGESYQAISQRYGVSRRYISRLVQGARSKGEPAQAQPPAAEILSASDRERLGFLAAQGRVGRFRQQLVDEALAGHPIEAGDVSAIRSFLAR
jgi:hypothetical protein